MSTILIVEDSAGQRALCAAIRESGRFDRVVEAGNAIKGLELLLSEDVDMVLCDLEMPGLDGSKLVRVNGNANRETPVPFLILTAVDDVECRTTLLREGASDAITKPYHASELIARVDLHLELARTRRELVERNRELELLSMTDPLTGIPNRRHLDQALQVEFARSRRYHTPFAVAMADIDRFKRVNDEYGHSVGDIAIRNIGGVLKRQVRECDCGGRFGGEEFLAILCNTDAEGAVIFAERWRQNVEAMPLEIEGGQTLDLTISVGVAACDSHAVSGDTLISAADDALYRAKEAGRNRVVVASGGA